MILTPASLAETGRALYGDDWEGTLAVKLERSRRTINRWRDGEARMPVWLRRQLLALIEEQQEVLNERRSNLVGDVSR